MRVTNQMIARGLLANLNNHLARMEKLHFQLSSGKRLRFPSDDPAATSIAMRLHTGLVQTRQHRSNLDAALSWLGATDSALDKTIEAVHRAKELAVYGATDTLPEDSRNAIADEVAQLFQHVIDIANTRHGGLYIFSGNLTLTAPYVQGSSITDPDLPSYQGDYNQRHYEFGDGVTVPVNVPGGRVFGRILAALKDLHDALRAGNGQQISTQVIQQLDVALDRLLQVRADVGARMNRLELARDRLDEMELNLAQLVSNTEDVDIARALVDLKVSENAYRAALAAGARIIQPSLMDFLR
ncbi:MAG: flagellar hook-associated protein FlgL [Limnochordales bacterium]